MHDLLDVCFIDDSVPADSLDSISKDTRISQSELKALVQNHDAWQEPEVKMLVQSMINEPSVRLSAFVHPNIYLDSLSIDHYRPDIVIFDWDYTGHVEPPENLLLEVLRETFALVYIYTQSDKNGEIQAAIKDSELSDYYERRLFMLYKSEENSNEKLLALAARQYSSNFSFRFGRVLRSAVNESLEAVLVQLGSYDVDFIGRFISFEPTGDTDAKNMIWERVLCNLRTDTELRHTINSYVPHANDSYEDVLELVCSRLRGEVEALSIDIQGKTTETQDEADDAAKIWAMRMYHHYSDDAVRRGDVISHGNRHFLVISPDCHLRRFWSKNLGYICLIPLFCSKEERARIDLRLSMSGKSLADIQSVSSLTNLRGLAAGVFACPFVELASTCKTLIGFPNEIVGSFIHPPEIGIKELAKCMLSYSFWPSAKRILTISEPFITPLIHHVQGTLSGYGTPDYPKLVQGRVVDNLKLSN